VCTVDDERNLIKHTTIYVGLNRESLKRVAVAFDLVAGEDTVDNGEIDANLALAETQLVKDKGIWLGTMPSDEKGPQGISDV
jgi:hypothetical protein